MTEATSTPPAKPGAEDLFEIFYAPSAVFERRKGGEFGLPLIALAVLGGVIMFATKGLLQPVFDADIATGLAKSAGKMTPEQLDAAKGIATTMTTVGVPITFLIAPFIIGAVAWLVAMAVGVKTRYTVAVMIATFSWFPRLVEWVVSAIQMAVLPDIHVTSRLSLSLGAGRFLDGSHPTIATAILGRVDVFTLWCTFLLGLGFMVSAKAEKSKAILIAVLMWVLGVLPLVWAVLRS